MFASLSALDVHERFGSWCQSRPKGVYYTLASSKFMDTFAALNVALVAEWATTLSESLLWFGEFRRFICYDHAENACTTKNDTLMDLLLTLRRAASCCHLEKYDLGKCRFDKNTFRFLYLGSPWSRSSRCFSHTIGQLVCLGRSFVLFVRKSQNHSICLHAPHTYPKYIASTAALHQGI
jgi:hypothetical protein